MTNLAAKLFTSLGLTQLMSLCVGADDSLPEKHLLQEVKTVPAGGLAVALTSNCVTLNHWC